MSFTKFIEVFVPLNLELWSSQEIHCQDLNFIFKVTKNGENIKLKFRHLYDGKIVMAIHSYYKDKHSYRVALKFIEQHGKFPLKIIDL